MAKWGYSNMAKWGYADVEAAAVTCHWQAINGVEVEAQTK